MTPLIIWFILIIIAVSTYFFTLPLISYFIKLIKIDPHLNIRKIKHSSNNRIKLVIQTKRKFFFKEQTIFLKETINTKNGPTPVFTTDLNEAYTFDEDSTDYATVKIIEIQRQLTARSGEWELQD